MSGPKNSLSAIVAFAFAIGFNFVLFFGLATLVVSIGHGKFINALNIEWARWAIAGCMIYPGLKIAAQTAEEYL